MDFLNLPSKLVLSTLFTRKMPDHPLVSFRLSKDEGEALAALSLPGESTSQTAQRIVRERLGLKSVTAKTDLEGIKAVLAPYIEQKIDERLEALGKSPAPAV